MMQPTFSYLDAIKLARFNYRKIFIFINQTSFFNSFKWFEKKIAPVSVLRK